MFSSMKQLGNYIIPVSKRHISLDVVDVKNPTGGELLGTYNITQGLVKNYPAIVIQNNGDGERHTGPRPYAAMQNQLIKLLGLS